MKEIKQFHDALKDVPGLASQIKESKKIIGHLCSYVPEELVYAAGFHPMRLFSSKSDIILAENHLQAYCCSLVRGILEDSLSGRLDFLHGTVFPHTCDTIMRLSDIWRLKNRYEFFWDVILPVKLGTQSAKDYMLAVLTRFKTGLEEASGKTITQDDLSEAVQIFNRIRTSLSTIYRLQSKSPGIISGKDLYALVKGAMVMERQKAAALLEKIADSLETATPPENPGKRIVLSGSICDAPNLYTAIEDAGAVIVGDDLCTGQRWFEGIIQEDTDPLTAIAERYMERMVCPAKHITPEARGETLTALAQKNRADGVIFTLLKFCDPHAFDYPYLKERLDEAGIKNLLIEMDDQQQSLGQLSTRIETFANMI
mgnify:CR=1 FL=1